MFETNLIVTLWPLHGKLLTAKWQAVTSYNCNLYHQHTGPISIWHEDEKLFFTSFVTNQKRFATVKLVVLSILSSWLDIKLPVQFKMTAIMQVENHEHYIYITYLTIIKNSITFATICICQPLVVIQCDGMKGFTWKFHKDILLDHKNRCRLMYGKCVYGVTQVHITYS